MALSDKQLLFVRNIAAQAAASSHCWPQMAACEAAAESGYGTSGLAVRDLNLFGMKQHTHPIYGTENIPTKEFLHGDWVVVNASWVKYPTYAACFDDRMNTLDRLKNVYPNYAHALMATDPFTYVRDVSATWSTDPHRADNIIAIYHEVFG
jgi:flagellum-specific peptidoglycan hydrolase FlgJ